MNELFAFVLLTTCSLIYAGATAASSLNIVERIAIIGISCLFIYGLRAADLLRTKIDRFEDQVKRSHHDHTSEGNFHDA